MLKQGRDFTREDECARAGAHGYVVREEGLRSRPECYICICMKKVQVHDCEISQLWSM